MVYVLNFDNSYKLISTALLGDFLKYDGGLSYLEIVPTFSIIKNKIIIKQKTIFYPLDMVVRYSKSDCVENKTYKIRINGRGQIERIN
ncbi:MAG: hypothetical protein AUJ97_04555 [Bacteroidetes bacterium CG2_30_32_10]|nr:MAG: hypothetical protein AUJ97_04555 [Bacteroidetes bacterium CG2_30_32_10]